MDYSIGRGCSCTMAGTDRGPHHARHCAMHALFQPPNTATETAAAMQQGATIGAAGKRENDSIQIHNPLAGAGDIMQKLEQREKDAIDGLHKALQENIAKESANAQNGRIPVNYRNDALDPEFLKLLAIIGGIADKKYARLGGVFNYINYRLDGEKGPINHIYEHLREYRTQVPYDNHESGNLVFHLAAIAYNAMMEFFYVVHADWYDEKGNINEKGKLQRDTGRIYRNIIDRLEDLSGPTKRSD